MTKITNFGTVGAKISEKFGRSMKISRLFDQNQEFEA